MTPDGPKRLVIFGCGYIGSALAGEALDRGFQVTALTRNPAKAAVLRAAGIPTVIGDLAESEWHDQIPAAPEMAVNCVSSGGGGIEGYRRSYVEGMASIAAWARRRGPVGTFVYTSSTSVYAQDGGGVVDETAPAGQDGDRGRLLFEAETQLRSGQAGEAPCWRRWFILRLAGIYGPFRQRLLDQVRAGEVAGTGSHHLNLIHRDDAVAAILACLGAPGAIANEIFNVADDGAAPKAAIVSWLAERLAVPAPRFTGQPMEGRTATPDRVIANAKLRARLGWRPLYPSFREGYASLLSR
jgi:nucleoside-diphosphate-sugar epimerase